MFRLLLRLPREREETMSLEEFYGDHPTPYDEEVFGTRTRNSREALIQSAFTALSDHKATRVRLTK